MKNKNFFILPIILENILFCISTIVGQTNQDSGISESFFNINLPMEHNQVNDKLVMPLRWIGTGSGLGFSYLRTSPKAYHEISLLMLVSGLKNRYHHKGYAIELTMEDILNYKVISSRSGGVIYLGPQIKWDAKFNFFRDWDDSHIYWLNSYEVGLSLKWNKYYKERQNISVSAQVPLFALVSRPPENQYTDQPPLIKPAYYFKSLNENLRFVTVNNYFSLRIHADYSFQMKSGNMIGGSWLFDYKASKISRNITSISNILMIRYYKIFGKK
jgi:hypothetical protein